VIFCEHAKSRGADYENSERRRGIICSHKTFVAINYLHIVYLYHIIGESQTAFIFMEQDSSNFNKNGVWWKPIMIFYVKITSWIAIPLILAILVGNYIGKSIGNQTLFFIFIMIGFGISCFGIYREIKKYKKNLDLPLNKNVEDNIENDRK
jgi:hypothetical protein